MLLATTVCVGRPPPKRPFAENRLASLLGRMFVDVEFDIKLCPSSLQAGCSGYPHSSKTLVAVPIDFDIVCMREFETKCTGTDRQPLAQIVGSWHGGSLSISVLLIGCFAKNMWWLFWQVLSDIFVALVKFWPARKFSTNPLDDVQASPAATLQHSKDTEMVNRIMEGRGRSGQTTHAKNRAAHMRSANFFQEMSESKTEFKAVIGTALKSARNISMSPSGGSMT